jgi:transposase-like protein
MRANYYVFDMRCPRCGATYNITGTRQDLPPRFNCHTCMFDRNELNEVEITHVTVFKGATP